MRIGASQLLARIALCVAVIGVCPACVDRALQAQVTPAQEQAAEQVIEAQWAAQAAQRHQQAEEQADEDKRELAADLASERANCSKSDTQNPDVIAACAHYAADKEIAANRPDPDLGHDAYSAYRDRLQDQALVEAFRLACSKSSGQSSDSCIAYRASKLIAEQCPDPNQDSTAHESCRRDLTVLAKVMMACMNHHDQSACIDIQDAIATAKRQQKEQAAQQKQAAQVVQAIQQEQALQIQEQAAVALQAQQEQARTLCYQQMTAPDSFQIESTGTGFQVTPYNRNDLAPLSAYWACGR